MPVCEGWKCEGTGGDCLRLLCTFQGDSPGSSQGNYEDKSPRLPRPNIIHSGRRLFLPSSLFRLHARLHTHAASVHDARSNVKHTHRNDALLLHAAGCVMEVCKLHSNLVVDWQEKLFPLLQLGFQLFAIWWTELWGSCGSLDIYTLVISNYL